MKIFGIGIDIVNINRFKTSLKKNRKIQLRIFSKHELILSKKKFNKDLFLAKRFAAKEAFSKALGTGISKGINFNEIVVTNNTKGKPKILLSGKSNKIVQKILKKKKFKVFISLSDDKPSAVAIVIIAL
jgi:holo-[acyl-carrier protein] synthase